jgi:hypothetical protein
MNHIETYLNSLQKTVDEDRDNRSELTANHQLAAPTGEHHIYVMSKGKKKSISGPHSTVDDAENHPARKFGDGVAKASELN